MKLLVGYDGSDGGRDALELARVLGEAAPLFEEAKQRLGDLEVETRAFGGGSAAGVINDICRDGRGRHGRRRLSPPRAGRADPDRQRRQRPPPRRPLRGDSRAARREHVAATLARVLVVPRRSAD